MHFSALHVNIDISYTWLQFVTKTNPFKSVTMSFHYKG